jgi:hypothetical protein
MNIIYFFFIQNWIYQTFVVLSVEIQNEKQENIWFKIQQNFKLLTISILFSNNSLNFSMWKKYNLSISLTSKTTS